MPFIISHVNCSVTKKQEERIKSALGKAIELVPGKTEAYLMVIFENDSHIWLRGQDIKAAYIEAKIFGNESHYGYNDFTQAITKIYNEILNIAPENIYVMYEDIQTWGVNNLTFEAWRE